MNQKVLHACVQILVQVWPNVNHYAEVVIKDVVEPNINIALAEYKMSGFKFHKMRLGTIVSYQYIVKQFFPFYHIQGFSVDENIVKSIELVGFYILYNLNTFKS